MTKGALLGQYATEIERLKMDLLVRPSLPFSPGRTDRYVQAAREKNGIFFSSDSWAELNAEQEARRLQLEDAKRQIDINDSQLQTTRAQFEMNLRLLGTREVELRRIGDEVARQSNELVGLAKELVETQGDLRGEMVLREAFEQSRGAWKGAAGDAFQDVEGLRNKLGTSLSLPPFDPSLMWNLTVRKAFVESSNATVISNASSTFTSTTSDLSIRINKFQSLQASFTERVSSLLGGFSERETQVRTIFVPAERRLTTLNRTSRRTAPSSTIDSRNSRLPLLPSSQRPTLRRSTERRLSILWRRRERSCWRL
jgi:kinesin family protein 11